MNELPILLSGQMVNAALEGRKTQTRRVIDRVKGIGKIFEFQHSDTSGYDFSMRDRQWLLHDLKIADLIKRCPYGQPGDRLWGKETHGFPESIDDQMQEDGITASCLTIDDVQHVGYRADGSGAHAVVRWRPSIYMPRWASRITMEIIDVRVEWLQDISESDAAAEGAHRESLKGTGLLPEDQSHRMGFINLWNSIYAAKEKGWDENPGVWVIQFELLQKGGA